MFTGFTEETIAFLRDIRVNNFPKYYEDNRGRYEKFVKAPLRALCEELNPTLSLIDPRLDTRPSRVMSRLRRDTRFTKDKSPFRDHIWLGWRYPGERRSEGFGIWWGVGIDWISWGCGSYAADKPLTDALRLTIRREPDRVREIFFDPRLTQTYGISGEKYKKLAVPEDVPEDLRELYLYRGFSLEQFPFDGAYDLIYSHALADRLNEDYLVLAPLFRFMQQMRAMADHAQAEAQLDKEEALKEEARLAGAKPAKGRSVSEFEF